jgi:AmmeMemoRadiSam system protein A
VFRLSDNQRLFLIRLARSAVEEAVRQQPGTSPKLEELEAYLLEKRACFVTLEKKASLRGCIGHLIPQMTLYAAVIDSARQAALADPRFSSVRAEELGEITLEISVLSSITPLVSQPAKNLLAQLQPFRHGVVLQFEDRMATFLPQVWEQIPDPSEFLNRLALKGGWEPTVWRDPRARVSVYEVESIQEIHPQQKLKS